jgi:hypothetical protein
MTCVYLLPVTRKPLLHLFSLNPRRRSPNGPTRVGAWRKEFIRGILLSSRRTGEDVGKPSPPSPLNIGVEYVPQIWSCLRTGGRVELIPATIYGNLIYSCERRGISIEIPWRFSLGNVYFIFNSSSSAPVRYIL